MKQSHLPVTQNPNQTSGSISSIYFKQFSKEKAIIPQFSRVEFLLFDTTARWHSKRITSVFIAWLAQEIGCHRNSVRNFFLKCKKLGIMTTFQEKKKKKVKGKIVWLTKTYLIYNQDFFKSKEFNQYRNTNWLTEYQQEMMKHLLDWRLLFSRNCAPIKITPNLNLISKEQVLEEGSKSEIIVNKKNEVEKEDSKASTFMSGKRTSTTCGEKTLFSCNSKGNQREELKKRAKEAYAFMEKNSISIQDEVSLEVKSILSSPAVLKLVEHVPLNLRQLLRINCHQEEVVIHVYNALRPILGSPDTGSSIRNKSCYILGTLYNTEKTSPQYKFDATSFGILCDVFNLKREERMQLKKEIKSRNLDGHSPAIKDPELTNEQKIERAQKRVSELENKIKQIESNNFLPLEARCNIIKRLKDEAEEETLFLTNLRLSGRVFAVAQEGEKHGTSEESILH